MMGVQATSARLFYDFCLDDHVPSDHILRSIDRHLDLDDVRQALKPFYSSTGRPSIGPESPCSPGTGALDQRRSQSDRRRNGQLSSISSVPALAQSRSLGAGRR
jgi:hypothetical protein